MRLILVRHGESASNRRGMAQAYSVGRGEQTEEEAAAAALRDELATEPNGDTHLTENGELQVSQMDHVYQSHSGAAYYILYGKTRMKCAKRRLKDFTSHL